MKYKSRNIPKLHLELRRICKQIGIHQCEIPELSFDYRYFNAKHLQKDPYSYRRKAKTKSRNLGYCSYLFRGIWINPNTKTNYFDCKQTLIHELVHYRFHGLSHGPQFEKRIKEIEQGKRFPLKQIQYPQGLKYFI